MSSMRDVLRFLRVQRCYVHTTIVPYLGDEPLLVPGVLELF